VTVPRPTELDAESATSPESRLFAALADSSRRTILRLLAEGPRRAGELAAAFPDLTRPAISKHLRVLREAGWAEEEKRGRQRIYSLRRDALQQLRRWTAGLDPVRPATEDRAAGDWAAWKRGR